MQATSEIRAAFVPAGVLRASINLGNPVLAGRDATGAPAGVSVDLARALAARLQAQLELVVFDAAGESVAAVTQERADVGFFAIDPLRGAGLHFTRPYILIEGGYLVREDSPVRDNAQVDAAAFLAHFVEDMKRTGFVAAAIERFGIQGAQVAPVEN